MIGFPALASLLEALVLYEKQLPIWAKIVEQGLLYTAQVEGSDVELQTRQKFLEDSLKAAVIMTSPSNSVSLSQSTTEQAAFGRSLVEKLLRGVQERSPDLAASTQSNDYAVLRLRFKPSMTGTTSSKLVSFSSRSFIQTATQASFNQ